MLELASLGAKVLQIRSVEFGMKYGVPIHVRSSFNDNEGTWVVPEEKAMEAVVVSGVTATKDEAKITLRKIADAPGVQAKVFAPLADGGIVVDMIVQAYIQDGAHRPDVHAAVGGSARARGRPDQGVRRHLHAGADQADDGPVARSRSSASACARTPASR